MNNKEGIDKLIQEVMEEVIQENTLSVSIGKDLTTASLEDFTNLYSQLPDKIQSILGRMGNKRAQWTDLGTKGSPNTVTQLRNFFDEDPNATFDIKDLYLTFQGNRHTVQHSGKNWVQNRKKLEILFALANAGYTDAKDYLTDDSSSGPAQKNTTDGIYYNQPYYKQIATAYDGDWGKDLLTKMEPTAKAPDDPTGTGEQASISDPTMVTQTAERGNQLEVIYEVFGSFLPGEDIGTKLEKLSAFANWIAKDKGEAAQMPDFIRKGSSNDLITFLSSLQVLEWLNTFVKEIDHGAGAYYFEAFLAFLTGGRSAGKEQGAAGGSAESDFYMKGGIKGSAKYLRKGGGVSQAVANFQPNQPVTYIVAYKAATETMDEKKYTDKSAATSDPDEITNMELSVFTVEFVRMLAKGTQYRAVFKIDGAEKSIYVPSEGDKKGQVDFTNFVVPNVKGNLFLVSSDGEALRQNLDTAANNMDGTIQQAYKAFEGVMTNLVCAKDKAKIYAAKGKDAATEGNEALTCMTDAQGFQTTLITLLKDQQHPSPSPGVAENNKKTLDKLIEEVILKSTLEGK